MKLKEKLAQKYGLSRKAVDLFLSDVTTRNRRCQLHAFTAGFDKAREMAVDAISTSDYDPTGFIFNEVRCLGEEKVEE